MGAAQQEGMTSGKALVCSTGLQNQVLDRCCSQLCNHCNYTATPAVPSGVNVLAQLWTAIHAWISEYDMEAVCTELNKGAGVQAYEHISACIIQYALCDPPFSYFFRM